MRNPRSVLLALCLGFSAQAFPQTAQDDTTAATAKALDALFKPGDIRVEPVYRFEHSVEYATTKTGYDGETKREAMELFFSGASPMVAMKAQRDEEGHVMDMFLVFDGETRNSANFLHSDTMNVCMRMRMPDLGKSKAPAEVKHVVATGAHRTIAGHEAAEWLYDSGTEETRLWLADVPGVDLARMQRSLGKVHGMPVLGYGDQPSGVLLAYSEKRKDAEAPHETMEAQRVKLNTTFEFPTAGYRIVQ